MNVLERYSVAECAVLLKSTRADVVKARIQALENVAAANTYTQHGEMVRAVAAPALNVA
jgi:hypothetical protein